MNAELLRPIIDAVAVDGFKPRLTADGLDLEGEIAVGTLAVPLRVSFDDLTLASSPRVFLPDISMLGRKVVPHVDDAHEFCVVNRQMYVFDRFKAAAQTRGLIKRAAEVLAHGMTKAGTEEIADEFVSYWASDIIEVGEPPATGIKDPTINLAHVTTTSRLSFDHDQSKPDTLGELATWATRWDKRLGSSIVSAIARLGPNDPYLAIHAPNGTVVVRVKVSARGTKFAGTFTRPGSWSKFVNTSGALSLKIERFRGRSTDLGKLFGLNGSDGKAPLQGKTIVQVGCGTIGGYLARMLVQSGAGLDAKLALIDPDKIDLYNVRRHQLGLGSLNRFKAEAIAEGVVADFPGVGVMPVVDKAEHHLSLLAAADLVIDATGEQEFSDWLNLWALERRRAGLPCPDLLFSWIAGAGAATQSFMVIDDDHACYRCLQPDPLERARFDPLKEAPPEPVIACGEQPMIRYGPAASTAAASLASSHAVDWALGRAHHLLRTIRIDWNATVKRDPKSPEKAVNCPACGKA